MRTKRQHSRRIYSIEIYSTYVGSLDLIWTRLNLISLETRRWGKCWRFCFRCRQIYALIHRFGFHFICPHFKLGNCFCNFLQFFRSFTQLKYFCFLFHFFSSFFIRLLSSLSLSECGCVCVCVDEKTLAKSGSFASVYFIVCVVSCRSHWTRMLGYRVHSHMIPIPIERWDFVFCYSTTYSYCLSMLQTAKVIVSLCFSLKAEWEMREKLLGCEHTLRDIRL